MTGGNTPYRVAIGAGAQRDLVEIHRWVADDRGADAAAELLDDMIERIEALERFPVRGPVPREIAGLGMDMFRQSSMGRYRLIYRVDPGQVTILMIADGRRDLQSLLEARLLAR